MGDIIRENGQFFVIINEENKFKYKPKPWVSEKLVEYGLKDFLKELDDYLNEKNENSKKLIVKKFVKREKVD